MEEKTLELLVQEKTLGKLITNAEQVREFVIQKIGEYTVDNYPGDEKQAAKDRAELNAAAKALNKKRLELEREFMSPFNKFKEVVDDTISLINQASSKLDVIVKEKERLEKEAKRAEIQKIWDSRNFSLVTLEKVFNSKWLNKGCKISAVESDIDGVITRIQSDLNALDSFGEDTAQLKELYLDNLNLQATLNKGAELKANRERLAAQKAEEEKRRAEAEARAAETQKVADELKEAAQAVVREAEKEIAGQTGVPPAAHNVDGTPVEQPRQRWIFNVIGGENQVGFCRNIAEKFGLEMIPSVSLRGSREQLQVFKAELERNGIAYGKMNFLSLELR